MKKGKIAKNNGQQPPKIVMVFGTFDKFHPGHRYFLQEAKKYGHYLIVVVARDKTVQKVKQKTPSFSEKERQKIIQKSKLADKVILGSLSNKYAAIQKYQPQIICLGYDQKYLTDNLKEKLEKMKIKTKIIRLKPFHPEKYKTSLIK